MLEVGATGKEEEENTLDKELAAVSWYRSQSTR
jgi:hypothetical protein